MIVFFLVLRAVEGDANIWAGRVFYVWTAVFNLFVPSVFWAFMTDIFTRDQAKRLFGIISAGGTLGALTGSLLTATLAEHIQPMFLLLFSVALLELSVVAVRRLSKLSERLRAVQSAPTQEQIIGGSVLAGIRNATSSPYLLGISLYMLLFTTLSTVLYFQLAGIVDRSLADRAARTAFFARVDLLTNGLALVLQLFAFGNLVRVLGLTVTLGVLPAISVAGFAILGTVPAVAVVVVFQAVRRAGEFAIARPAREVLFIVLPREDRYKAKNFIDTVVYRLGDQVGAWSQVPLGRRGPRRGGNRVGRRAAVARVARERPVAGPQAGNAGGPRCSRTRRRVFRPGGRSCPNKLGGYVPSSCSSLRAGRAARGRPRRRAGYLSSDRRRHRRRQPRRARQHHADDDHHHPPADRGPARAHHRRRAAAGRRPWTCVRAASSACRPISRCAAPTSARCSCSWTACG